MKHILLYKIWFPVYDRITLIKERICRSFDYAVYGWLAHDFDFWYVWDILDFKLKRVRKCLIDGHAYQHKKDMNALSELIEIVGRLKKSNYYKPYYAAHDKKWGSRPRWLFSEPDENGRRALIHRDRPKVRTAQDRKKEQREFLGIWKLAKRDKNRDIQRIATIIKDHGDSLWD